MVAIFCTNPDTVENYQKRRFEVLILRKKRRELHWLYRAQEFSQAEALTIFLDKQTKGPLHTQDKQG